MGSSEINLCLEPEPEAASTARRALDELRDGLPEEQLVNLQLLVSELVTNAIRHGDLAAEDRIGLRVTISAATVGVEVTDTGVGFDPGALESPEPESASGWGLPIVEKLSDRWGVRHEDHTTRVWFEISL